MNIYHNGELFHTDARQPTPIGTVAKASMGLAWKKFCDGAIDNLRIYKAALTAAEVKDLYLNKK